MIRFYVSEFMQQKGYKAKAWTLRKMGIPERSAYQILNNELKSVKLVHLEKLCILFNCTPNDLLDYQPETEAQKKSGIELLKICKDFDGPSPLVLLSQMTPAQMAEASRLLQGLLEKKDPDCEDDRLVNS